MPFVIVPASQVAKKATKQSTKGRPQGSTKQKIAQQRSTTSGASRTTVTVAAYGARLFEPLMTREKPIHVHFKEFIVRDEDAITRFSEDGWFAIKFFLVKDDEGRSRCYLVYFINPIDVSEDYTLMRACDEAVEYKVYEFRDTDKYVEVLKEKLVAGRLSDIPDYKIHKLRAESALGQAEQMIINVLRDKITAEKFLKRQKEFEKQNQAWQLELERLAREEEQENEDVESEESITERDTDTELNEDSSLHEEEKEDSSTSTQEGQEVSRDGVSEQKTSERSEPEVKSQPKPFVWGGKR